MIKRNRSRRFRSSFLMSYKREQVGKRFIFCVCRSTFEFTFWNSSRIRRSHCIGTDFYTAIFSRKTASKNCVVGGLCVVLYALAVAASKRLANAFFAAGFLDRLSRYNFDYDRPLVICAEDLSENQITSVEGTSSGKFVLAILEENREFKVSPVLEDLVLQSNKIRVSAHAARLAKLNTQRYSHLESINLTIPGHTARPIWYLHDSKASEVVCL